jgi:hypothetical protein
MPVSIDLSGRVRLDAGVRYVRWGRTGGLVVCGLTWVAGVGGAHDFAGRARVTSVGLSPEGGGTGHRSTRPSVSGGSPVPSRWSSTSTESSLKVANAAVTTTSGSAVASARPPSEAEVGVGVPIRTSGRPRAWECSEYSAAAVLPLRLGFRVASPASSSLRMRRASSASAAGTYLHDHTRLALDHKVPPSIWSSRAASMAYPRNLARATSASPVVAKDATAIGSECSSWSAAAHWRSVETTHHRSVAVPLRRAPRDRHSRVSGATPSFA